MLKTWRRFALRFAVSAILIWLLVENIDIEAAWTKLSVFAPGAFALAVVLLLLQMLIGVLRWMIAQRVISASLGFVRTLQISLIGLFFNQTLPSSIGGDAVRMWKAHRAGLPLGAAVNGVMIERIAHLLGLFLMVAVSSPLLFAMMGETAASWAFPALAATAFAGVALFMTLDRLPERWQRWGALRVVTMLAADLRKLFLSPRRVVGMLALSVLGHSCTALSVLALARGLNLMVTALDCLVLVPPVVLLTILPVSIAGWGVREGAMIAAFGFIGVPAESAFVLSVLFGLVVIVIGLPGGAVWLFTSDRRIVTPTDET